MRILIMGNNQGSGGAQTAFREFAKFSERQGITIATLPIQDDRKTLHFHASTFNFAIPATTPSTKEKLFKFGKLLVGAISARVFRPDIFVAVGLSKSSCFIARILSTRTFCLAQDFISGRSSADPLLTSSIRAFDGIAVQSPSMIKASGAQSSKIQINWLPCFPEAPVPNVERAEAFTSHPIRLAYFGRLAGNKGLPLLLAAVASIPHPNRPQLDIWGAGEIRSQLDSLIEELSLQQTVVLKGHYPNQKAGARLIASYDGLVLCSTHSEGLPLILLEVMAYGVPFMATDVGAIRDCCIDNADALLVPPSADGIFNGLKQFLSNLTDGRFSPTRHRSFYQERFSHQALGARWNLFFSNPEQFFND